MGATMFKGFFIQARRTNLSMDTDEAIGTFSGAPNGTQLLECTVANVSIHLPPSARVYFNHHKQVWQDILFKYVHPLWLTKS